ncbi:hypothetical protein ACFPRL_32695 [Pseudoclavibacter helvolus]
MLAWSTCAVVTVETGSRAANAGSAASNSTFADTIGCAGCRPCVRSTSAVACMSPRSIAARAWRCPKSRSPASLVQASVRIPTTCVRNTGSSSPSSMAASPRSRSSAVAASSTSSIASASPDSAEGGLLRSRRRESSVTVPILVSRF